MGEKDVRRYVEKLGLRSAWLGGLCKVFSQWNGCEQAEHALWDRLQQF